MPRVQFLTNASCPDGRFGAGATADLDEATALDFERQGAVKILEDHAAPAEVEATPAKVEPPVAVVPPVVDPPVATPPVELSPTPPGTESLIGDVVQITASDGAQAQSKAG